MKIKNNILNNIGLIGRGGSAVKGRITIPAGATLELDDTLWLETFEGTIAVANVLKAGSLSIVEAAKSSLSKEEMLDLIREQAGVAVDPSKSHAEVQALATALSVDLTVDLTVVEEAADTEAEDESEDDESEDDE